MTTTMILVRHGRTAWNREDRFRGRAEVPLDGLGVRQAVAAASAIAERHHPVAVYSSPLGRATTTAAPIAAALGLPVTPTASLMDIDFGALAGLTTAEAAAQRPEICRAWATAPHTVTFPGGESLHEVRARAGAFAWSLNRAHPDAEVVLVSHLVVCRALVCYLLGLPESAFYRVSFDTASISVLALEAGSAALLSLNDTGHLRTLVDC